MKSVIWDFICHFLIFVFPLHTDNKEKTEGHPSAFSYTETETFASGSAACTSPAPV